MLFHPLFKSKTRVYRQSKKLRKDLISLLMSQVVSNRFEMTQVLVEVN